MKNDYENININAKLKNIPIKIKSNVLDDVLKAKINGRNTVKIIAGDNIKIEQQGEELIISTAIETGNNYNLLLNKPKINNITLERK